MITVMRSRLYPVQIAWLGLVGASAVAWAVVFLPSWKALSTACRTESDCASFQVDAHSARLLGEHGITLIDFAVATTVALGLIWAIWIGLGALIIWRKPDDRGAVVAAFATPLALSFEIASFVPGAEVIGGSVSIAAMFLFGLLFPDGRFVPGWMRWVGFAGVPAILLAQLPPVPTILSALPTFLVPVTVIAVQVYRYRRVSTWVQRQRTKWAVMGMVLGLAGFVGLALPYAVAPQITGYGSVYDAIVNVTGTAAVVTMVPVFIAIAVLRSGLWDIDRLINRALVYATLSLTLAGTYLLSILVSQSVLGVVVGHSSGITIALSTLAIAALFGPLRRTIQRAIDRRFYRSKYDAARTLADFTTRVRDEVDLSRLSEDVTEAVRETLQPAHVSLWLAESRHGGEV